MCEQSSIEDQKKRCVILFRYKVINDKCITRRRKTSCDDKPFVEIEIRNDTKDTSGEYQRPDIQRVRDTIEVRVYDETGIDIKPVPGDLLGDWAAAERKCQGALGEAGWTIVTF